MGNLERPSAVDAAGGGGGESLDPRHFYAAYVFDDPETRHHDVAQVMEQARQLGYSVRYWWLSQAGDLGGAPDRLIVCAHHPSAGENAGMDLYDSLKEQQVSWDDLEAAAVEEYRWLGKPVDSHEAVLKPDKTHLFPRPDPAGPPRGESSNVAAGNFDELPEKWLVESPVTVITVRGLKDWRGIEYVGRSCAGWKGSDLGNRFAIGKDGTRPEVIQKYRSWLWSELQTEKGAVYQECIRLAERIRRGEEVILGCWCKPVECHAEVVKAAVLWLAGGLARIDSTRP